MPEVNNPIVIRPSGIWNSRAPLHNYILEIGGQSKSTSMLILAISALGRSASESERSGNAFLKRIVNGEFVAANAWHDYRRSFGLGLGGKLASPTVKQICEDAFNALYDVREMSIVRRASIFEAFAQCWSLNYLAAKLESGKPLSIAENSLALSFNPVIGKGHFPSWPQITKAIPLLKTELIKVPHLFVDPKTRQKVDTAVSVELNAFTVVQFWRAYRNLAVHMSRQISRRFFERYGPLYATMMTELKHLEPLEPGRRMPLHDDLYSAMGAAQFRAATWMNQYLVEVSSQRRGHPEAPGPKTKSYFSEMPRTPQLFMEGDHEMSFLWTRDVEFRTKISKEQGWNLPNQ